MNIEEQSILQENNSRPFNELPGLWIQLPRMTEAFFSKELPRGSVRNTLYSLLLITVNNSIISGILMIITCILGPTLPTQKDWLLIFFVIFMIPGCLELVVPPISYYFYNSLIFIMASILGGKGKFSDQAYLRSLFYVPFGIISSLLSFTVLIPQVGIYIFYSCELVFTIFKFVYTVRSIKVVHTFSTGRAVAACIIPEVLYLIPECFILYLGLVGRTVGNNYPHL